VIKCFDIIGVPGGDKDLFKLPRDEFEDLSKDKRGKSGSIE